MTSNAKSQIRLACAVVNLLLFIVGVIGVWIVTHSLPALLFTFVASLHLSSSGFINAIEEGDKSKEDN